MHALLTATQQQVTNPDGLAVPLLACRRMGTEQDGAMREW